jgi:hypothetical protein
MQREGVTISTKGRDHKMHFVLHEPTDEVHVSGEAIQPRDNQRGTGCSRFFQCRGQPRSQEERVLAGARLDVLIPRFDLEPFTFPKGLDVVSLRRQP